MMLDLRLTMSNSKMTRVVTHSLAMRRSNKTSTIYSWPLGSEEVCAK